MDLENEESIVHTTLAERRMAACPRCGFVRKVRVTHVQKMKITYKVTQRPGRLMKDHEEISRENYGPPEQEHVPLCGACDCIRRAEVHEEAASEYRIRAGAILAKRNKRS
jgi:hypothetical protein